MPTPTIAHTPIVAAPELAGFTARTFLSDLNNAIHHNPHGFLAALEALPLDDEPIVPAQRTGEAPASVDNAARMVSSLFRSDMDLVAVFDDKTEEVLTTLAGEERSSRQDRIARFGYFLELVTIANAHPSKQKGMLKGLRERAEEDRKQRDTIQNMGKPAVTELTRMPLKLYRGL